MPPVSGTDLVIRPRHYVWGARLNLLIAAGAPVGLQRGGARDVSHQVVASLPLDALGGAAAEGAKWLGLATTIQARHVAIQSVWDQL
jgi:hypothetical protein